MQTKTFFAALSLAAASLALAAPSAHAGFMASSGSDAVTVTDSTPSSGDTLMINSGTFSSYTPDTAADPQLTGGDLARYGYTLNVVGGTPNLSNLNAVNYTGTYEIFYNTDTNDTRDAGDIQVSSGIATLTLELVNTSFGQALQVTAGSLTQTPITGGPANPAFADFSYGGNDVGLIGFIQVPVSATPVTGTANLQFRQLAPIPEPATAGLLGVAALGLLSRRRRA